MNGEEESTWTTTRTDILVHEVDSRSQSFGTKVLTLLMYLLENHCNLKLKLKLELSPTLAQT